jgi:N-acetylneuraminic acid mutarotase
VVSKGYVLDINNVFWEYNLVADLWSRKADFCGFARSDAVGFSIAGKGYIGTGSRGNGNGTLNDFWEYDPTTNAWSRKADFGGVARVNAVGLSIRNKGYLGTGRTVPNGNGEIKDFWEYNPDTDS